MTTFIDLTDDDNLTETNHKYSSVMSIVTKKMTLVSSPNKTFQSNNGIQVPKKEMGVNDVLKPTNGVASARHNFSVALYKPMNVLQHGTQFNGNGIAAASGQHPVVNVTLNHPVSEFRLISSRPTLMPLTHSPIRPISQISGKLTPSIYLNSNSPLKSTSNRIPFYDYFYSESTDERSHQIIVEVNQGSGSSPPYKINCPMCNTSHFNSTIDLHLIKHFYAELHLAGDSAGFTQCLQCLRLFKTPYLHQLHQERCSVDQNPADHRECLICEKDFHADWEMALHFQQHHTPRDMPYVCPICFCYRASHYYKLKEHLVTQHKGTHHLPCPYCLKCFHASYDLVIQGSNEVRLLPLPPAYLTHLRNHLNGPNLGCSSCRLVFLKSRELRTHQICHHKGQPFNTKDEEEVQRSLNVSHLFDIKTVRLISDLPSQGRICVECGLKCSCLKRHFLAYKRCPSCRYATCCSVMYTKHMRLYHKQVAGVSESSFGIVNSSFDPIGQLMICQRCGYRSVQGNQMADHMVLCGNYGAKMVSNKVDTLGSKSRRKRPCDTLTPISSARNGEKKSIFQQHKQISHQKLSFLCNVYLKPKRLKLHDLS